MKPPIPRPFPNPRPRRAEDGSADPVKFKIMLPPLMPAPLIPTLFMPVHMGGGAPDAQQGGLLTAVPVSASFAQPPDPHAQDPSVPPPPYPVDPLLHSIDPLSAAALAAAAAAGGGGRPDEPVPTAAVCIIPPLAPPPLLCIQGEVYCRAAAPARGPRRPCHIPPRRPPGARPAPAPPRPATLSHCGAPAPARRRRPGARRRRTRRAVGGRATRARSG